MKTGKATLADIRGDSAEFRRLNPHLFARGEAPKAPNALISAHSSPVSPQKGIRTAPQPKTRPEREMDLILKRQREAGEIHSHEFEGITLSVGDGTRYTPDFAVRLHSGKLRFVEVKGPHIREDGLLKWKAAKGKYPFDEWQLWQLVKSGWTRIA